MSWLGRLLRKRALDRDLDRELRAHLDLLTDDLMRSGRSGSGAPGGVGRSRPALFGSAPKAWSRLAWCHVSSRARFSKIFPCRPRSPEEYLGKVAPREGVPLPRSSVVSLEGWILLEDSPRDPILQDPDRVWANIRQRLAERRRRELPPARPLAEFRRSCAVSQEILAGRLGIDQTRISKLERRSDLRLSALRAYVASLGGTLVLLARMPDRDVQLNV